MVSLLWDTLRFPVVMTMILWWLFDFPSLPYSVQHTPCHTKWLLLATEHKHEDNVDQPEPRPLVLPWRRSSSQSCDTESPILSLPSEWEEQEGKRVNVCVSFHSNKHAYDKLTLTLWRRMGYAGLYCPTKAKAGIAPGCSPLLWVFCWGFRNALASRVFSHC